MRGEMLGLGNNGVVRSKAFTLRASHISKPHLSTEIGVFSKVFFDAAPTRIAREVKHRRKDHVYTGGARLSRDSRACLLCECRIPCCRQIDRRRKDCPIVESVQPFFDKDRRDPQAIVPYHPFLNGISLLRRGVEIMDSANPHVAPKLCGFLRKKNSRRGSMCFIYALVY